MIVFLNTFLDLKLGKIKLQLHLYILFPFIDIILYLLSDLDE